MMKDRIVLKPCPFCGSKGIITRVPDSYDSHSPYYCKCSKCEVKTKRFVTDGWAMDSWNTRAETTDKWISVDNVMPRIGQKVLLLSNGVVQEDIYIFDKSDINDYEQSLFWSREDLDECPEIKPEDKWQPLPSPPKPEEV